MGLLRKIGTALLVGFCIRAAFGLFREASTGRLRSNAATLQNLANPITSGLQPAVMAERPTNQVAAPAPTIQGYYVRVIRVIDGDTLTAEVDGEQFRVRLIGMDAPEHDQLPWGADSTAALQNLIRNEEVFLVPGKAPRDKYGRLLADVFVGTLHVNREMVRRGHALLLTIPPNVAHADELREAQTEARAAGRGAWDPQNPLPETPSAHRHR